MKNKKLAVIFPGIGYNTDKPLLHYAIKLAAENEYEYICVNYGDLTGDGIREKMQESIEKVMGQVEKQLSVIDTQYEEILFISKSIGSAVAAEYIKRHNMSVRQVVYTPIKETLSYPMKDSIVFHGTADSWCDTEELKEACVENHSELYLIEGANHSLEIDNTITNIENMKKIMEKTERFIRK